MSDEDEEAIRLTAYFLWEQDGRPEGRHDSYWLRAREMHARQRTFDGLLKDGPDEGNRDEPSERT